MTQVIAAVDKDTVELADVIAGWSTLAAAVFAATAAVFAFLAWRREVGVAETLADSEAERKEQARRAQALLVSAWIIWAPTDPVTRMPARFEYVIRNASDSPVYQFAAEHWYGGELMPLEVETRAVVPPSSEGMHRVVPNSRRKAMARYLVKPDTPTAIQMAFVFRDSAGAWWRRSEAGDLDEYSQVQALADIALAATAAEGARLAAANPSTAPDSGDTDEGTTTA